MAAPTYNRERAARILIDAISLGDRTAADRHGVSEKTVQRHRARLLTDTQLSELVRAKSRVAEQGWHVARSQFLRKTFEKLEKMVEAATPEHFDQVINALKAAGELELATEALGVGVVDRQQGPAAPEDQGGPARPLKGEETPVD